MPGWLEGHSSIIREFIPYNFEEATRDPLDFLRSMRDAKDCLVGPDFDTATITVPAGIPV
jgi:hypothetical protein